MADGGYDAIGSAARRAAEVVTGPKEPHCACGCTGCTAERVHAVRDIAVEAGGKYLRRALEAIAEALDVPQRADYGAKANGVLLDDILARLDVPQEVRRGVI